MKIRLDLLEQLTIEDIAKTAEKTAHRFTPEPVFSKTGVGKLSPTSTEEHAQELAHSMELTQTLLKRAQADGKPPESRS